MPWSPFTTGPLAALQTCNSQIPLMRPRYVKARLEESFAPAWPWQSEVVPGGGRTMIEIPDQMRDAHGKRGET